MASPNESGHHFYATFGSPAHRDPADLVNHGNEQRGGDQEVLVDVVQGHDKQQFQAVALDQREQRRGAQVGPSSRTAETLLPGRNGGTIPTARRRSELTDAQRAGLYAYLLEKYGSDIKPPAAHTLEEAWKYLPRYDWGLPRRPLAFINEAIRNSQQDTVAYKTLEPRFVEVLLNPAATPAAKDFACRRLAIIGSAASVPALAKLLSNEGLSNMACFALERIPDSAAQEALRQALGALQGNRRTGVIQALGNRRGQSAVADLVRLLTDEDPAAHRAAAVALGKIGGPAAAEALTAALANAPSADRATLADSCLMCAEQFRTAGMKAEALALYQRLRARRCPGRRRLRRRGECSRCVRLPGLPCRTKGRGPAIHPVRVVDVTKTKYRSRNNCRISRNSLVPFPVTNFRSPPRG